MFLHSTRSEACFGNVLPHGPASVKLEVRMVGSHCARQAPTSATRLSGAGRNHFRVLAHLAQYEKANEAIIATTILLSVGIYFLVQLIVVASDMLGIFLVFCVRLFQPFPLRDGSIYFGTAPWYFLSRCTSVFPVQTCRRELGTSGVAHV